MEEKCPGFRIKRNGVYEHTCEKCQAGSRGAPLFLYGENGKDHYRHAPSNAYQEREIVDAAKADGTYHDLGRKGYG